MEPISTTQIIIRLAVSLGLGGIIGFERERDNQPAGLRTHMILVLGACLAMILSINLGIEFGGDPARLAAQVVSGIGFLGAGAILRFGVNIKGLTTATTLWTMAIVGMAVGYGYYLVGVVTTALMLLTLTVLHLFEHKFVRVNITRNILIDVNYKRGVVKDIRKLINSVAEQVTSFMVQKSVKDKHLRIEIIAQFKRTEKLEDLIEHISDIDGVRNIKID